MGEGLAAGRPGEGEEKGRGKGATQEEGAQS